MAAFIQQDSHTGSTNATCGAVPSSPVGRGDITAIGQTFQAGSTYSITKITLRLRRDGTPGLVTVKIYGVDGEGLPTGSSISSGQTNGNDLTTNAAGEDRDIALSSTSLSSGTTYAVVLTAPDGTPVTDWIKLLGSTDQINGGYADGITVEFEDEVWAERIVQGIIFTDAYFTTWSEGDFRQIDTPTPTDTDTGISLTPNLQWQIDGAGTTEDNDFFFIYLNETGTFTDDDLLQGWRTSLSLQILSGLSVGTTYYWQVQAISENGDLLDSAVWSFTTSVISPPVASAGLNNMVTIQRLVAAGRDKIFYEDI